MPFSFVSHQIILCFCAYLLDLTAYNVSEIAKKGHKATMFSLKRQIRHAACSIKSTVQMPVLIAVIVFSLFSVLLSIAVIIGALRLHWFQSMRVPHGITFVILLTLLFVFFNAVLQGCVLSDCKRVHRLHRLTGLCIYLMLQLCIFAVLPLLAFCFSHILCHCFFLVMTTLMVLLILCNAQISRYVAIAQAIVYILEIFAFLICILCN